MLDTQTCSSKSHDKSFSEKCPQHLLLELNVPAQGLNNLLPTPPLDKLQFFLFADDTNIYFESKDLKLLEKTVNEELKKLSLWLNLNRLALNVSKTNFVIFRSYQKIPNHKVNLVMNNKSLEQKDHVKYLGVLLDQHLNWKKQIKNVSLKVSRGLGIIAKLKPFLKDKLIRTIYFSVVYSHLYLYNSFLLHGWRK